MPRRAAATAFDPKDTERWLGLVRSALWAYFRPRVIGAEHLPRKGRALIIGCHSGVVPYDAACTLVAIHDATGRFARAVGDNWFGNVDAVEQFLRQKGALVGRPEVVAAVLRAGHLLLLFPGGARDMERSYLTQRYQVLPHRGFAPGHGGYIKIALRTRAPIVPLAVVGAEEAHVMLGTVPWLAQIVGTPFFPLLLFPWPLPVKLYIRFGEPIVLPGTPADADNQRRVDQLNIMVRQRVQSLIDDTVRRRHGVILSTYDDGGIASPAAAPSPSRRRPSRPRERRQ
jgi:1-acyl-sn-glycerol-3-phosphate acyltransferase